MVYTGLSCRHLWGAYRVYISWKERTHLTVGGTFPCNQELWAKNILSPWSWFRQGIVLQQQEMKLRPRGRPPRVDLCPLHAHIHVHSTSTYRNTHRHVHIPMCILPPRTGTHTDTCTSETWPMHTVKWFVVLAKKSFGEMMQKPWTPG